MNIKMPLRSPAIDAKISDLQEGAEVYIFSDTNDLLIYSDRKEEMDECTIFSLWINCGKNKEAALMFDVEINELEEFANAILNKIKIVRKDCNKQIQYQVDNGNSV